MPVIDGFELARLIHEIDHEIKIICMSAFDIHGDDLIETEMDEYMQKPIHIAELIKVIQKHLTPQIALDT